MLIDYVVDISLWGAGIIVAAVMGIIGWFANKMHGRMEAAHTKINSIYPRIDQAEDKVSELHLHIAQHYVPKTELVRLETRMDNRFDKVDVKLDNIAAGISNKADRK